MYILKGFVNISALSNNNPAAVAALGELSNKSMTYAIEKGYYQHKDTPGLELVTFTSKYDQGAPVKAPVKYTEHVLLISYWIFMQSVANKFSQDADDFQTLVLKQWGSTIKGFECGKMITCNGQWLPAYIKWSLDDPSETNYLTVWFADSAFKTQYDEYQLVVISPYDPVDVFQKTISDVETAMATFNVPDHHKKVETVTKGEPHTYLISKDYPWYDREDPTSTVMTTWSVAIYGAAGNSLEIIKGALKEYILNNSNFDLVDWVPVFPDIFTSTEFSILPFWDNHSVPDASARASLYSPFAIYDGLPTYVKQFVTFTDAHLQASLVTGLLQYKSLLAAFIGGLDNRDQKFKITDYFPDYAVLDSKSPDFSRMTKATVEWSVQLLAAVILAEEMDEYSYLGESYARIYREDLMYIGFSYNDVSYLVLSRLSMLKRLGIAEE